MFIQKLRLYSSRLHEQVHFYKEVLGLPLIEQDAEEASFGIGRSVLNFQFDPDASPYHFAINIPANQEQEALQWVKKRVDSIAFEGNQVQDFPNWNAKALYFYDADRNIVEFIARKNLDNASDQPFDSGSLLELSEIGLPSEGIQPFFEQLHGQTGIDIYSGSFDRFCAIGDERGLFICVDTRKKDTWFPTEDKIKHAAFELAFEVEEKPFLISYQQGKMDIRSVN